MEVNTYIDYNLILYQLEAAEFLKDWDIISTLILTLQRLIVFLLLQELLQDDEYLTLLTMDNEDGD